MKTVGKYLRIYVHLVIITLVTSLHMSLKKDLVSVQNGSSEVILDCPFEMNDGDVNGLVIKWFYGDDVTPTFQWIPEKQKYPQDIGFLKGRIDVSHNVTSDRFTSHRALYIQDPTIDMNGKYTCYVSNFLAEDLIEVQLTVYIPPKQLEMYYQNPDPDTVMFICEAEDVFPEPELELYYRYPQDSSKINIETANESVAFNEETQTYNATIYYEVAHSSLNITNNVGCVLRLRDTDYTTETGLTYLTDSNVSCGVQFGCSLFLCLIWFVIFLKR